MVHPGKQEIEQRQHEACVDEHGATDKTQTQRKNTRGRSRVRWLRRNIQTLPEHAGTELATSKPKSRV